MPQHTRPLPDDATDADKLTTTPLAAAPWGSKFGMCMDAYGVG